MSQESKRTLRSVVRPITPIEITIRGAQPLPRTFHADPRGFLIETLRFDDGAVEGSRFRMSYSSLTLPGRYRDADRWHVHRIQTDRFVVVLGEMTLALLDDRSESPTRGRLEVIRMNGVSQRALDHSPKGDVTTYLVPVPPGVLHCIGNLGLEPFLLQNHPTELYSPSDEGRIPFVSKPVESLGRPFVWDLIERQVRSP